MPPGGDHRDISSPRGDQVDDFGYQGQGGTWTVAVPTGLGALSHQHIGADLQGSLGLGPVLDLADQPRSGGLDGVSENRGVPERQHHRHRLILQREVEQLRLAGQRPGDEPAAHRRSSGEIELPGQPIPVPIAAPDEAESPCATYRGSQLTAGDQVHWRGHYRIVDSEHLAKGRR